MRHLTPDQQAEFRRAVEVASAIEGLPAAIDALYAEFQTELDARRPRCDQSGRCCRFNEFGHLLFVTTAEMAVFVGKLPAVGGALPVKSSAASVSLPQLIAGSCIFQINNLCSVHASRPFGCRVFFCDPTATDWQQRQYDLFHSRIKQLHEQLGIPYMYVEWRQGLTAARLMGQTGNRRSEKDAGI
jgi:Fe-S-cluster containining protein